MWSRITSWPSTLGGATIGACWVLDHITSSMQCGVDWHNTRTWVPAVLSAIVGAAMKGSK